MPSRSSILRAVASQRTQLWIARNGTFLALLALITVFAIANPRFLSLRNAEVIGTQIAEIGVIAIPMALLLIAGSVDLSVGSVASMAGVVTAIALQRTDSAPLAILAGIAFGAFAGAINGFLISYLRMNMIVVTLGFLAVWAGAALLITGGRTLFGFPDQFADLGSTDILGLPLQLYVLVSAIVLGWWILNRSAIGRGLYALGGNERAAFLMGVRVRRLRFAMFVYVGASAALAGVMLSAKLQASPPNAGAGLELSVLTVVLLGGIAFSGGAGRISGVIAGLIFVGVLRNGLVVVGASQFVQQVLLGLALIVGVAFDDILQRLSVRSWDRSDDDDSGGSEPELASRDA